MARFTDYIENDAGWRGDYDIYIDTQGLMLSGRNPIRGKFTPGPTTAKQYEGGETPLIFNDFSNGMGMGYSGIPNTYAYSINGYARTFRKFMPGGKLTEIPLTDLVFDEFEQEFLDIKDVVEWNGDIYVLAGSHILKLEAADDWLIPSIDYYLGEDTQAKMAVSYNNILMVSTANGAQFDNWQYLTALNPADDTWVTANSDGTYALTPDADGNTYPIQTGADNYEFFERPVYLENMVTLFQEVDGVGGYRLFGNNSLFDYIQIQSDSTLTVIGDFSSWGAEERCGGSSYAITNIAATNRIPFIIKGDGVYGIESSGVYCPNYTPDLQVNTSSDNGSVAVYFAGKLFVGTPQGLLMVDVSDKQRQDVPTYVSPSFFLSNETPIFGLPTAYTIDNGWLVISLWNGTDSHVCYTRPRETTQATFPNPMIWHGSECTIEGEKITAMRKIVHTNGLSFIYIGTRRTADDTWHLYRLSVPVEGDPFMDYLQNQKAGTPGHEFATECKMYLPFQDADDPNAKKIIRRFDVQADGLTVPVIDEETGEVTSDISCGEIFFYANANSGSRVFFESVDPDNIASEWVFQGVVADSPKATMIPNTTTISGYQIGIVLDCYLINREVDPDLDPEYSPFAVRSIKVRTDLQVDQVERKTYTVKIGEFTKTRESVDFNDTLTKFITVMSMQDADAVYMINEWRERLLVKVEPGTEYAVTHPDGINTNHDGPLEVTTEISVTILGRQFYYDVGHPFDNVYAWGS